MAIPTQPTATTICTEAYKLFGIQNPSSSRITRATDYGMEIVKADIKELGLEWDFLRTTGYITVTQYLSYVQLPTDFAKLISARVMMGTRTGTLQAGGASSAQLAAADSGGNETIGKYLVITSGNGVGEGKLIIAFNTSTKSATVDSAWTTQPDSSSTYLVVDEIKELKHENLYDASTENRITNVQGRPEHAWIKSDSAEGKLYFDRTPDQVYVIQLEYYADILKVDLSSTLYSRILRLLNGLFIQGVFVWLLQDDARVELERSIYEKKKAQTAGLYLYPYNLSSFSSQVDYE